MSRSYAVIINAGSGSADMENKVSELKKAFNSDAEITIDPEFFLAHGGEAIALAVDKALANGHDVIVAAGGDGTINGVTSKMLGTSATLGIIPIGTFNHLAKDLGIPLTVPEAVNVIISGQEKLIDIGQVNGKIFLNNSGIGLYPKIISFRDDEQKIGWSKWVSTLKALFSIFRSYSFLNADLRINGQWKHYRTPFIFIGNNEYEIDGLSIGGRKQLDAGQLCVYVAEQSTRGKLFGLIWHAARGKLRDREDFDSHIASQVDVATRKKFISLALDGELVTLATPLQYKILPKAIKVMS